MAARLSAFVIWALVAAGVVFWGYRFWAGATPLPPAVQVVGEGPAPRADLTRVLGAAPAAPVGDTVAAAPAESSRFRLVGVLAPKAAAPAGATPRGGVALIAVDGRAPRAYAVGARIDGDLLLTAVTHRSASLGAATGAPAMVLELPALPAPATGTLARAVGGPDGARPGPIGPLQAAGAGPGGGPRSPAFQAQQPGQAPGGVQSDEDEDDEAPAPAPAPANRARPGGPLTR